MTINRYALVSVDTEALPKRAPSDHLNRLIWGRHERGTAGIRELCSVAEDFCCKLVFFVDACGDHFYGESFRDMVRWLDAAGHDVQLHTHSEYLPETFWTENGFKIRPRYLNQYDLDKALFTLRHFSKVLSDLTGKPVLAYRAGSFRWNANTLRAMADIGISLSSNNSMAALGNGQCLFSSPTNRPFRWSNGILEIPMTERYFQGIIGEDWWGRLQFPAWNNFRNPTWRVLRPFLNKNDRVLMVLLHSWSLLYWDDHGYAIYRNDKRIDDFRKMMRRLTLDYDVITTAEYLDLVAKGKIDMPDETMDITLADMPPPQARKK